MKYILLLANFLLAACASMGAKGEQDYQDQSVRIKETLRMAATREYRSIANMVEVLIRDIAEEWDCDPRPG